MWKIFYMMYVLNKMRIRNLAIQKIHIPSNIENEIVFIDSLKQCIGQTITIFVIGGGYGGSGYTGILMGVKEEYISIYFNPMTLAEIPISKIACFSHNII